MTMTTEQNKAIVRGFYKAFEANDQASINELLAPDSWPIHTPRLARKTA
jgi:ketosteroid isomerase-like protein